MAPERQERSRARSAQGPDHDLEETRWHRGCERARGGDTGWRRDRTDGDQIVLRQIVLRQIVLRQIVLRQIVWRQIVLRGRRWGAWWLR